MASMAARCASSALLGTLEPLSAASSSSTSTHAATAFFPAINGLEFASQASFRGTAGVRSAVRNVEGRAGAFGKNLRGVRASGAGVMESATPTTREDSVIVNVDLGDRSYPIYIGAGLLNRPELLQKHVTGKKVRRCVVFLEFLSLNDDRVNLGVDVIGKVVHGQFFINPSSLVLKIFSQSLPSFAPELTSLMQITFYGSYATYVN